MENNDYYEENELYNFLNDTNSLDNNAYYIRQHYIDRPMRPNRIGKNFVFYIHGPRPLTDEDDLMKLSLMFCKNIKNIDYIEIGAPEESLNGMYHQHALIKLNESYRFSKKPLFRSKDGTEYTICLGEVSKYTKNTRDFDYYLKYMRKHNNNKPFFIKDNIQFLDDNQTQRNKNKPLYDTEFSTQLQNTDYNTAINEMTEMFGVKFLKDKPLFSREWMELHGQRMNKAMLQKPDLKPFREDLQAVKDIRRWIGYHLKHPTERNQNNLFIVGDTLTGKTEFVIQEVYLKIPSFLLRGDFTFINYNENDDYKFMIFDDVNYIKADIVQKIKHLTSTVNNLINIDVKYGNRVVKSKPIIHIMNPAQFDIFRKTVKRTNETDWWDQNSTTVIVKEPLYTTEDSMESEQSEESLQTNKEMEIINEITSEEPIQEIESVPTFENKNENYKNPDTTMTELIERNPDTPKLSIEQKELNEKPPKTPTPRDSDIEIVKPKAIKPFKTRMMDKLSEILSEDLFAQVQEQIDEFENDETMEEEQEGRESYEDDQYEEMIERNRKDGFGDNDPNHYYSDGSYRGYYRGGFMNNNQQNGYIPEKSNFGNQHLSKEVDGIIYD